MTLQTTHLHATHISMNAKMVDFGGWDMPVNYGSQIAEHQAVRTDAGMFDVSHMCVIDITGENVRSFLQHVLANDVAKLQVTGKALYSCLLNENGGIIDDLIVYFFNENHFRLVVNASTADNDFSWLQTQNKNGNYSLELVQRRPELAMIALQGPNARQKLWQLIPNSQEKTESLKLFFANFVETEKYQTLMVARTGYTGEDGFEITVSSQHVAQLWTDLAQIGVQPCGLGARDTLRLEAGMNLYGQDMNTEIQPSEVGLSWTVSLTENRDFIGKKHLSATPQKTQMLGLILLEKGGILRGHQIVKTAHGDGEITSGTFSPTMQQSIAMALLPVSVQVNDTVSVVIRDKLLNAKVVKLPFVRNGKIMV